MLLNYSINCPPTRSVSLFVSYAIFREFSTGKGEGSAFTMEVKKADGRR